jgi:high mobility group protein B1
MWNNIAVCDKQPYKKKAAKLKEKCEKDIAAYRAKGKPDAVKMGVVKAEKSKKKKEEEDEEEDEEDEEEEEEEEEKMMIMNKLVLAQFFFLSIKHLTPCTQLTPFNEKKIEM